MPLGYSLCLPPHNWAYGRPYAQLCARVGSGGWNLWAGLVGRSASARERRGSRGAFLKAAIRTLLGAIPAADQLAELQVALGDEVNVVADVLA